MRLPLTQLGIALLFAGLTFAGDNTLPQLTAFSFSPTKTDRCIHGKRYRYR